MIEAVSKDIAGRTPLSFAAAGKGAVVSLLLARTDVDADSRDSTGRPPFSWAAGNGRECIVATLLARENVDADSTDGNGRTPLWWAGSYLEVVRLIRAKLDSIGKAPLK